MAYVFGARMALLSVLKVSGSCEGNLDVNEPATAPDGGSSVHAPSADAAEGDAATEDEGSDGHPDGNLVVVAEAATSVDDAASLDSGVPVASDL